MLTLMSNLGKQECVSNKISHDYLQHLH